MPVDRIAKLYEGLTLKERAILAFSYLSELNSQEADRILATVPRKLYRMVDADHIRWVEGLRRMAMMFGMEHWRFQAKAFAASSFLMHMYNKPDVSEEEDERIGICFKAWGVWETRLLTMDAALEAVCSKHNVNAAAVRRCCDIEGPHQALGPGEVDAELLAEMTKAYDDLLQGWE
jgi:hypothetical protein